MEEKQHFLYQGKVKLNISGSKRQLEITRVENLIPLHVYCRQGDDEVVVSAYMNYVTNTLYLPEGCCSEIDEPDVFKEKLFKFLDNKSRPAENREQQESYFKVNEFSETIDKAREYVKNLKHNEEPNGRET